MVLRDPNTGRFVSTRDFTAFNRGEDSRDKEFAISIFLFVVSLLLQVFEKAGFVLISGINIAIALIPTILLIFFVEEIIEERYLFVLGYWFFSLILFFASLVSFWEMVFDLTFPLLIFLLVHHLEDIISYTNKGFAIILFVSLSIIVIISFVLSGQGQSNILNNILTTVNTTISTSSISTSTSTTTSSTTTIIYVGICNALSGFLCTNVSLSKESKLSVTIGEKILPTMYNIQIGCGTTAQANGFPNAQFYNETFNLTKSQLKQIDNLTCRGAQNGTLVGYVWMNYTKMPGNPNPQNNSYYENEIALINISREDLNR